MSTTATKEQPTSLNDENVTTAVLFLQEVYDKGYDEVLLKRYLLHKCGLNNLEVVQALKVHNEQLDNRPTKPITPHYEIPETKSVYATERYPTSKPRIRYSADDVLQFLVPGKQPEGLKLIKDFLKKEWKYCNILSCLDDYHKELTKLADRGGMFDMTSKEAYDIFLNVTKLLKFHQVFYTDLKQGFNIGQLFIKCFNFFKGYIEYMKSCTSTINKMRQYTRDKKLHNCLGRIRQWSRCPRDDMFDLLLVPLDHIGAYKEFLDQLLLWADKTQTTDYEYLAKATRRIGRVADYVEKYKYWIFNRNEMNRVQRFLDKQYDVLASHRRIIRRGMMTRRSVGWSPRNKRLIFFLFNDLLLWTTEKGELQNVVQLWNCKLLPSDSKSNTTRSFKLAFMGESHGTMFLECQTQRQRSEWFKALQKAIAGANDRIANAWSKAELQYQKKDPKMEEENFEEDVNILQLKVNVNPIPASTPMTPAMKTPLVLTPTNTTPRGGDKSPLNGASPQNCATPLGYTPRGYSIFANDANYDGFYDLSDNFRSSNFKEYEPMDDIVSTTENDCGRYSEVKTSSLPDLLNTVREEPEQVSEHEEKDDPENFLFGAYTHINEARSKSIIQRDKSFHENSGDKSSPRDLDNQLRDSFEHSSKVFVREVEEQEISTTSSPSLEVCQRPSKTNALIRRNEGSRVILNQEDVDVPQELLLRSSSSHTIRLVELKPETVRLNSSEK